MIVTSTPARDLAYTNFAYCSPADLRNLLAPGSKDAYASIGDVFVISVGYPFDRARSSLFIYLFLFYFIRAVDSGNVFSDVVWAVEVDDCFRFLFLFENVVEFGVGTRLCRFEN